MIPELLVEPCGQVAQLISDVMKIKVSPLEIFGFGFSTWGFSYKVLDLLFLRSLL